MKSIIVTFWFITGLSIATFIQAAELPVPTNQKYDNSSLDFNQAFTRLPDHSELKILSQQEMKETQGALGPVAVVVGRATFGAAAGATTHAIKNHFADRPLMEGVEYTATVGAIGGAAAAKLVQLSGWWMGKVTQPGNQE